MTVGYLVTPAIYILRNKCLWNRVCLELDASADTAGPAELERSVTVSVQHDLLDASAA